jgi:hypothetical protein
MPLDPATQSGACLIAILLSVPRADFKNIGQGNEFDMHLVRSVLFILGGAPYPSSILSASSFFPRIFPSAELHSQLLLSHPK